MLERITLRLPLEYHTQLTRTALDAGYASAAAFARCVVIQFLNHQSKMADERDRHTQWIDDMARDELDPRNRKAINERL